MFIIRMAEAYLIAAEADVYLNGGSNLLCISSTFAATLEGGGKYYQNPGY